MTRRTDHGGDCDICMGRRMVMVGMTFPPNKTIAVKYEYDFCPGCTPPPHTFHAKRTAQILRETRERNARKAGELVGLEGYDPPTSEV